MALDVGAKRINKKREAAGKRIISFDDDNITIEILLRLPVRSLIRFRCVCKLWHSITHDPYFIDTHLERARKLPAILFYPVVFYNPKDPLGISHLDDHDENNTTILPLPKPYCPRPRPRPSVKLTGSCNGLLALHSLSAGRDEGESILVLNPSTRESVATPEPTKHTPTAGLGVHLGFDPVTKEYKVLRFFGAWPLYRCEVYTLGASSWRQLCTTLEYAPAGLGASAEGAMYWYVYDSLVCFDLRDELFTWISLPNFNDAYQGKNPTIEIDLYQLQGRICIPVFNGIVPNERDLHLVPQMDLWMLINDGRDHHRHATATAPAPAQWTRKYSVILPWRSDEPMPLLIRNEKILVQYRIFKAKTEKKRGERELKASLLLYLPLQQDNETCSGSSSSSSSLGGVVRDYNYIFHSYVHVESLVPLRQP